MSHKFNVGDKVRIENFVGDGDILCNDRYYNDENDHHCLSPFPIYDVKYGNQIIRMFEEGLEKIEECRCGGSNGNGKCMCQENKYKIGDRVIFYFTEDEVKIGIIEEIDTNETYKVLFGDSYYILSEKDIIAKSEINQQQRNPDEEFKEGDTVWVKATVSPWPGSINNGEISNLAGETSVNLGSTVNYWIPMGCIKKNLLEKTESKNEWISVKEKLPEEGKRILVVIKEIYHKSGIVMISYFNKFENGNIYFMHEYESRYLKNVTHWKPLDAPPEE